MAAARPSPPVRQQLCRPRRRDARRDRLLKGDYLCPREGGDPVWVPAFAGAQKMRGAVPGREPSGQTKNPATQGSRGFRSEEHTSELQSLMRLSYAVFCLQKKQHTVLTPI